MDYCNGRVIYYCDSFIVLLFTYPYEYQNCGLRDLFSEVKEHESCSNASMKIVILKAERGIYNKLDFKIYSIENKKLYAASAWAYPTLAYGSVSEKDYYTRICKSVDIDTDLETDLLSIKVSDYTGHTLKDMFDGLARCLDEDTYRSGMHVIFNDVLCTVYDFMYFVSHIHRSVTDCLCRGMNVSGNSYISLSHVFFPLFFKSDLIRVLNEKYPNFNHEYDFKIKRNDYHTGLLKHKIDAVINMYPILDYDEFLKRLLNAVIDNDFVAVPFIDNKHLEADTDFVDWLEYTFDLPSTDYLKYKIMSPELVELNSEFCYNEACACRASEEFDIKYISSISGFMNSILRYKGGLQEVNFVLESGRVTREIEPSALSTVNIIEFHFPFRDIFELGKIDLHMNKDIFIRLYPYLYNTFILKVQFYITSISDDVSEEFPNVIVKLNEKSDGLDFYMGRGRIDV